jgi:DNA-binding response OmpR family regulator
MPDSTILLVEDEILLREGIQEILEANDYKVIGAADGAEALEWLDQVPVTLVISDLVMPNMDGMEFVQRVRVRFPDLPVIIASGSPGTVMSRLGIDSIHISGATASISKPFKSADLVALIKQVLQEAKPAA